MKNVVVGAAMNYGVEQIRNFVLSFRKYNQEDDIFLIYKEQDVEQMPNFKQFLIDNQIKIVTADDIQNIPIHVVASRFFKYYQIATHFNLNKTHKHILFSDVRDVFFQSNPFDNLPTEDYLYAFCEDTAVKIDKEPHHLNMIHDMFGFGYINNFANKDIICSGTILGTANMLTEFFGEFCDFLVELHRKNPSVCYRMLLDQVIANQLFYFGKMKDRVTLKKNGDIVGTIGHCITYDKPSDKLEYALDDAIVYLNSKVPAVVHQYDRSPELFNLISNHYAN